MAALRTRTLGWSIALAATVLALHPIGPLERALDIALLPTRLATMFAAPARAVHRVRFGGAAADVLAAEAGLSLQLERAVLLSAWPSIVEIGDGIVPVPGEVGRRIGRNRDTLMLSVVSPERVQRGQPVVVGDVYVGSVSRIPSREEPPDRPDLLTKILRKLGLASRPRATASDLVEVQLITDPEARVGGLVEFDQDNRPCRLVVGGLAPRPDLVWLAIHNPESRATRSGRVVVKEPLGLVGARDGMAEGFLLGDLVSELVQADGESFTRVVQGVRPLVDFESGLNQLLVLTDALSAGDTRFDAMREAVPVLEDRGWQDARFSVLGDASVWRSTARLDRGKNAGVRRGAAVVDGVRLVGRVARSDQIAASVALLDDPGFRLDVLAQAVAQPSATPLVLGTLESRGRDRSGRVVLEWSPEGSSRHVEWMRAADPTAGTLGIEVRLWTGSGMTRVPRGLLIGRTWLTDPGQEGDPEAADVVRLTLEDTGSATASLAVRIGSGRLVHHASGGAAAAPGDGVVHAAETPRAVEEAGR